MADPAENRPRRKTKGRCRKTTKKNNYVWIAAVCGIICLAVTVALVAFALKKKAEPTAEPDRREADAHAGVVSWNGKRYEYNDKLTNYLVLGVDTREIGETNMGSTEAGQVDAIYLVSYNRVEKTGVTISIPRDTMTEIAFYSKTGRSMGKGVNHISLSYAYGDGKHESCRLTKEAVSNLFYDLPIQSYCALSMDGLPVLTESVGTVEVTVPNDSMEKKYPQYRAGTAVTLDKESTEAFVRYRDTDETGSALARMERQQAFLQAFEKTAKEKMGADAGYAARLYLSLEPYMVTSMGKTDFVKLAEGMMSGGSTGNWTVPGSGAEGALHDEYHVDDEALYEKIIETFYVEIPQEEEREY